MFVGQHQLTCLMHRRTCVPHRSLTSNRSARQLRRQFTQWATTWSQACRYRIGLEWIAARLPIGRPHDRATKVAFASPRIVAKQFGRCEHQVCGLRTKTRGIVPDVVRPETEAPTLRLPALSGQMSGANAKRSIRNCWSPLFATFFARSTIFLITSASDLHRQEANSLFPPSCFNPNPGRSM